MLWLKIACVVAFIAIMAGLHFLTTGTLRAMGDEFTYGVACGIALTLFFVWVYWPSTKAGRRPEQE